MRVRTALRSLYRKAITRIATPIPGGVIKPDFESIAGKIVKGLVGVKRGDMVLVEGRRDNLFFCELIGLECRKIGAHPLILSSSDEFAVRSLTEVPLEFVGETPEHLRALVRETDVLITTSIEGKNPELYRQVPEEKIGAKRQAYKFYKDEISSGRMKWVGMGFPTREQARVYGINFSDFHNMFWRAMGADYDLLSRRAETLAKKLEGAGKVTITSKKGTNIEIGMGERRVYKDDGIISEEDIQKGDLLLNLPSGEVCFAPLEDKANGRVVFDLAFHQGRRIEDLEIEFRNGIAIPRGAKMGFEVFKGVIANSMGDKEKIGELGIGLNPEITRAIGYMLTDEKMLGTAHIAVGDNRMMGGINTSDLHWDLLIMDPTIVAGTIVVMKDGKLQL